MQGRARFLCLDSRHIENVIGVYWFAGRWILGSCKNGEHISRALIVIGTALLFMSLLALRKSFACLLHRGENVVDWMSWSAKEHSLLPDRLTCLIFMMEGGDPANFPMKLQRAGPT